MCLGADYSAEASAAGASGAAGAATSAVASGAVAPASSSKNIEVLEKEIKLKMTITHRMAYA